MHGRKIRKKSILNTEISIGTSVVDLVMLTKHLSVMLAAGMTVPEALDTIVEQANGPLKRTLKRVYERVQAGSSLGDALAMEPKTFSPVFVSAAVVGENSGTLAKNLKRLATQMDKDLQLRRQIQSASLYPAIILSAAVVLGLGIATFVLPKITSVFASLNTELPFTTRALLWIAKIFDHYGVVLSIAILAGIALFVFLVRQKFMYPITHRIMLSTPAVKGFVHDINRARFCRTLGTLLESGTPITDALAITRNVIPNVIYKKSIKQMRKDIGSGEKFSDLIQVHEKLYPKMITRMAAVGEESGSLGSTLTYLASYYEDRVNAMSKNLASVIEPVLLIGIGLIVALIAISVITPIYSITSSIEI